MAESLAGLQRSFLGDLNGTQLRTEDARAETFAPPPAGDVEARWAIYAHGYFHRLEEALALEYSAIRRIVGPDAFSGLIARYLSAFPPKSFDLAHAGGNLARHLADDPLLTHLPFLVDLARLERAVAESFVARDAAALTWTLLRAMKPDRLAHLPLDVAPSTFVVRSAWPIADLWAARLVDDDAVDIDVTRRPQTVLVHRRGFGVHCDLMETDAIELFERIAQWPTTLATLEAQGLFGRTPEAADRLTAAFVTLVAHGALIDAAGPVDVPARWL